MHSADRRRAVVLGLLLAPLCGACSHGWLAPRPRPLNAGPQPQILQTSWTTEALPPLQRTPPPDTQPDETPSQPVRSIAAITETWSQGATEASDSQLAWLSTPRTDPDYPTATWRTQWGQELCLARDRVWRDHRAYYSWPTGRDLLLGVGAAAVFANTSWDQDIRDWYQRDVRSSGSDDLASFWKVFGEGEIFIGAYAGMAVAGKLWEDRPLGNLAGQFGGRVTRSYLVGAPPMLFMQALLGGSRPDEDPRYHSSWKPFDDNNAVSGHAFIGSVPFITAAQMSERPLVKGGFYFLSILPAWSRVNDDSHYFSQACLGWWMGYLACRAVDDTSRQERPWSVTPVATPEMTGFQLTYQR